MAAHRWNLRCCCRAGWPGPRCPVRGPSSSRRRTWPRCGARRIRPEDPELSDPGSWIRGEGSSSRSEPSPPGLKIDQFFIPQMDFLVGLAMTMKDSQLVCYQFLKGLRLVLLPVNSRAISHSLTSQLFTCINHPDRNTYSKCVFAHLCVWKCAKACETYV